MEDSDNTVFSSLLPGLGISKRRDSSESFSFDSFNRPSFTDSESFSFKDSFSSTPNPNLTALLQAHSSLDSFNGGGGLNSEFDPFLHRSEGSYRSNSRSPKSDYSLESESDDQTSTISGSIYHQNQSINGLIPSNFSTSPSQQKSSMPFTTTNNNFSSSFVSNSSQYNNGIQNYPYNLSVEKLNQSNQINQSSNQNYPPSVPVNNNIYQQNTQLQQANINYQQQYYYYQQQQQQFYLQQQQQIQQQQQQQQFQQQSFQQQQSLNHSTYYDQNLINRQNVSPINKNINQTPVPTQSLNNPFFSQRVPQNLNQAIKPVTNYPTNYPTNFVSPNSIPSNPNIANSMISSIPSTSPYAQTDIMNNLYIYQVQFKFCIKHFTLPQSYTSPVQIKDFVVVEADRGEDIGVVIDILTMKTFLEKRALSSNSNSPDEEDTSVGKILRLATNSERLSLPEKYQQEESVVKFCKELSKNSYNLPLIIVNADYQFDRNKLTIYYSSDQRVDFREFVRELFSTYRARIWMKRIGNKAPPLVHWASLSLVSGMQFQLESEK